MEKGSTAWINAPSDANPGLGERRFFCPISEVNVTESSHKTNDRNKGTCGSAMHDDDEQVTMRTRISTFVIVSNRDLYVRLYLCCG